MPEPLPADRAMEGFDLFQALRGLEAASRAAAAAHPARPREACRCVPAALSHSASLAFAPVSVARDDPASPRPTLHGFGLLGPNGPMPIGLTELAADQQRAARVHRAASAEAEGAAPSPLVAWLDLLQRPLRAALWRAWAQARPAVGADGPQDDPIGLALASVAGYGLPSQRGRDSIGDDLQRAAAGLLSRTTRSAEALEAFLRCVLNGAAQGAVHVPVRVRGWQPRRWPVPEDDRARLAAPGVTRLGHPATLGPRVLDRSSACRIELGPLDRSTTQRFVPGRPGWRVLRDAVLHHAGPGRCASVRLWVDRRAIPFGALGLSPLRLGRSAWLVAPTAAVRRGASAGLVARLAVPGPVPGPSPAAQPRGTASSPSAAWVASS